MDRGRPRDAKRARSSMGSGKRQAEGGGEPRGVTFSPHDKASIVFLSRDRRTATCTKGYRLVKATKGVAGSGSWYCEFTVSPDMKPGSHCR